MRLSQQQRGVPAAASRLALLLLLLPLLGGGAAAAPAAAGSLLLHSGGRGSTAGGGAGLGDGGGAAQPPGSAQPQLPPAVLQASVPARYCPAGTALEGGLCYKRCRLGWSGLACTCWKGLESYSRGCGVRPRVCQAASYRRQRLPPVAPSERGAFSLVLSADPQTFRVLNDFRREPAALAYNAALATSINRAGELGAWPAEAGGGPVRPPRALVVLGDMTEYYREDEVDAFRAFYDPSLPPPAREARPRSDGGAEAAAGGRGGSGEGEPGEAETPDVSQQVTLPTWLMLGNHDYVINVNDCAGHYKSADRNVCARRAVDTMRSVLTPGCDDATWAAFPRTNVTSFDAGSMAYSFDVGAWHFVVLQYSPRYVEPSLSVRSSLGWLAAELSSATAQGRRIVLLLHAHRELGLAVDPTFTRLVANSNVAAIFYGHVHIKPWGMTGNFPNTNVPMFNCGASWYHVYCLAEFGPTTLRVGAVVHNASLRHAAAGDPAATAPRWFGTSVHALLPALRAKPVLQQFSANPNQTSANAAVAAPRPRLVALAAGLAASWWLARQLGGGRL